MHGARLQLGAVALGGREDCCRRALGPSRRARPRPAFHSAAVGTAGCSAGWAASGLGRGVAAGVVAAADRSSAGGPALFCRGTVGCPPFLGQRHLPPCQLPGAPAQVFGGGCGAAAAEAAQLGGSCLALTLLLWGLRGLWPLPEPGRRSRGETVAGRPPSGTGFWKDSGARSWGRPGAPSDVPGVVGVLACPRRTVASPARLTGPPGLATQPPAESRALGHRRVSGPARACLTSARGCLGGPPWTDSCRRWPSEDRARWLPSNSSCGQVRAGPPEDLVTKTSPCFRGLETVTG